MNEGKSLDRAESSNLAGLGKGMYGVHKTAFADTYVFQMFSLVNEEVVPNQVDLICNTYIHTRGHMLNFIFKSLSFNIPPY